MDERRRRAALLAATVTAALTIAACTGPGGSPAATSQAPAGSPAASSDYSNVSPSTTIGKSDKGQVTGAGSTAIFPFLSKIADAYQSGVASGVSVNYQSIGSGGGIAQFTANTVDFGASDIYLSDEQEQQVGAPVFNLPMIHWAVALTYNIPGFTSELRFSPDTVAGIYLGKVTKWNDPAVAADNPGVELPDLAITVVHRSDGSGTTFNFTSYLSDVSTDWKSQVGSGTSVNWPTGAGGKGNEGVTALVRQTPGAIGYVELSYALRNGMPVGSVKNAAGAYVSPSLASTTAAVAAQVPTAPADLRFLIVNPPASAPDAYPIGASTWILLRQDYPAAKADEIEAMVHFLWWAIHDGQSYAESVSYSAMAPNLVRKAEDLLKKVTVGGQPILAGQ